MITMPLHAMPLVYAAVFLVAILALWLTYSSGRERRRRETRRMLSQCRLCAEWLSNATRAKLFRCPACGALNEHNFINDI